MKSISKLKDEARRYEQREEWEKAIQAYLQVLRTADEGETEVELPLYNRVGDLCVRLGKPQEAVRHYEQAADRYAEAGLYNNAIALCNKALRYSPDRLELIRKLGQFSASQGFITDARRYFLDYAERQFNAGKVTEALSALEDFANVSDDADIREMLGRQLHAHGRINDAVDELRRAYALRVRDGHTDKAAALRAEIQALDPNAKIDGGAAAAPTSGTRTTPTTDLPGLVDIEPDRTETRTDDIGPGGVEGFESGSLADDESADIEPVRLSGFETTGQPDLADIDPGAAGGIEGLETTTLDFGAVEPGTASLEDLGLESEETTFDGPVAGGEGAFDLPLLDEPDDATALPLLDDRDDADLPTLDSAGVTELPPLDGLGPAGDADTALDLPEDGSFDLPLLGDDDEAEPLAPPQIDSDASLDLPSADGPRDFGLGGDLPLDLSSLGGAGSMFDLPASDEDAIRRPDQESGAGAFDIPDLDEAPDLPGWEPEPGPSFELPSFETEVPGFEESAFADEEPVEETPPEVRGPDPVLDAGSQERPSSDAEIPEAIDIPAIELPTWETGVWDDDTSAVDDVELPEETEAAEPSWVDAIAGDVADSGTELPTFTYEDDAEPAETPTIDADDSPDTMSREPHSAGAASASGTAGADSADDVEIDDDPLGLAAHLASRAAGGMPPVESEPAAPDAQAESDWLDEIAADEPAAGGAAAIDDSFETDPIPDTQAGDDGFVAEDAGRADASAIEDPGADAARAAQAARDMAVAAPEPAPPVAEPPAAAPQPPAVSQPPAATSQTPTASQPPPPSQPPATAQPPAAAPGPAPEDGYVDLGALIAGDDEEATTRFRVQETAPTGDEDRDFAELLSQFKSKVQEHLPAEDAGAHYDLGLAFKEMGLIDEAIGEFQIALRAGHMRLRVYEELGQCFLQKEQFNIAEKVLSRALTMKFDDELELLGVYYHLGRAYEALGRRDQARDAYERVLGMDINFGDVNDRLARL
ncbi:MAG TPA: tetratricopeptide repeat protein [Longimicrobiales bacterium]|nr:tetratricopeptide repeat protein [Longimicrobiales bacterium]